MTDREIVGRPIHCGCVFVDERGDRVPEDIGVGLVFHHDQEHMIEFSKLTSGSI
jgi:hypothetical protein